jgi:hypothetical protein
MDIEFAQDLFHFGIKMPGIQFIPFPAWPQPVQQHPVPGQIQSVIHNVLLHSAPDGRDQKYFPEYSVYH